MKKRNIFFIVIAVFTLDACTYFSRKSEPSKKDALVRVYDKFLFPENLAGIVPPNASESDSMLLIKNYIDNWIHQQVVLHKAESNLDEGKKDVEKQLDEYRNSLIRYAYEKALIEQRLDTGVSDKEIEEFYNSNPGNFELKSNILKVIYLKLNKKSPKLNKVRDWYQSDNQKDRDQLRDYCRQYALNYYLDEDNWLMFDDLLKEIPIKTYDQEQFLHNNRNIEIEDSTTLYLISIKGFKVKNSLSPLSFERNNIRNMIINQRKLKLVAEMEQQAYDDARKKGDFEILK
ncbi:MAG: hypothetical protein NTV09_12360 [Bacteroidetes bacterium]|nr:hypothetical protein [Bacteroidota bacterium]